LWVSPISAAALYNDKGFDIPKVIDWVYTQKKPLHEFPGRRDKDELARRAFQPCEIAIPAAIEIKLRRETPSRCRQESCAKAANGPTTWQADAIIDAKGIFTVPDILGNAGGVR